MRRFFAVVCAGALAVAFASCGPSGASPEKVCEHLEKLSEKAGGQALEQWESTLAGKCVRELAEEQKKRGEKYADLANCITGSKTLESAMEKCK